MRSCWPSHGQSHCSIHSVGALESPLKMLPPPGDQSTGVSLQPGLPLQLVGLPAGAPLRGARILVAAHTNTAVDRVLTSLVDAGYTGEARVPPEVPQQCACSHSVRDTSLHLIYGTALVSGTGWSADWRVTSMYVPVVGRLAAG